MTHNRNSVQSVGNKSWVEGALPSDKTPGISAAAAWRQIAADAIPMPGRICQAALFEAAAVDFDVVDLLLGGVLSLPASVVLGTFLSGVLDFSESSLGVLGVGASGLFELLIAAIRESNWILAWCCSWVRCAWSATRWAAASEVTLSISA